MAREHLIALAARTPLLAGADERMFLDIDSLLRPVYGHAKQGASFGHAKIASRALLRLGLSPQITTISTATAAPVIAEAQLRSGKAASGAVPHTSSSRRSPPRKRSTPTRRSWCAATQCLAPRK
ncbi:putative tnpC protein [Mycobacterium xenopi 4042]|uniref:Putative tnpC protein n=1 Tax=Mycobacterium xenopi 4042 TaxID=1299334 RepID=X7Z9G5_MYCXE|nr:putative tnpC protein [Mycobacterium xenopi 4042]